jgi:hypothetical protein
MPQILAQDNPQRFWNDGVSSAIWAHRYSVDSFVPQIDTFEGLPFSAVRLESVSFTGTGVFRIRHSALPP